MLCVYFFYSILVRYLIMSNGYRSTYYPYWGNSYNPNYTPQTYMQNNNYSNYNNAYNQPQMPNQAMPQQPIQNNQQAQQMQMQPYNNIPVKTNKLFVTSVDEAINRSTEFNTETIYFHQDLPIMYEVAVDGKGRKEVYTYDVKTQNNPQQNKEVDGKSQEIDTSAFVTVKDFNRLQDDYNLLNQRFEKLLSQLRVNSQQKPKQPENRQNFNEKIEENK